MLPEALVLAVAMTFIAVLPASAQKAKGPDLVVRISAPPTANAGDDIGASIHVQAANSGGAPAPGTKGTLNPANGYMIDVVLSTDGNVAAGFATYSPNFAEDVLLQGGRISNTVDLAPGATHPYPSLQGGNGKIPANTPTGGYLVCARIDSGNKVAELNEANNVNCAKIRIKGKDQPTPPTARKPDLIIRAFGLKQWGKCAPNNAVFTFQVTVANIGTAPSPAIPAKALVQAMDQHGNGWGNGAILGAIPAGGSQTVLIPVYYLQADPGHMTAAAPHPFQAIADPLGLVDEANEANNKWAGSPSPIMVGAPQGCPKP